MVDRNIIREFDVSDDDLMAAMGEAVTEDGSEQIEQWYDDSITSFQSGRIIEGHIINVIGDDVVVDVGYKSEGILDKQEFFQETPQIGDTIKVLLENVESESGLVQLSKRKADRIIAWEHIIETCKEGDVVEGKVTRKIKGGLLVNIGVPVFLPASQVDIRRPPDIGEYVDRQVKCQILKIDTDRRNIVVSRRKLIEREREEAKVKLMAEIEVGQTRKGIVKNIADFGVFVDLGGIDGLLHITDMSWGRISHPSEVVKIEEELEIKILNIDKEREKIALGLKQLQPSPWEDIGSRYPVGSKITGEVVNIMSYGAFVKLEEGVEGLVHISEMSWTRRINHPSEMLGLNDSVDVVVLEINKDKQEISLGMKQTQVNPWTIVAEKYPPGTLVEGRVRNLVNYGAFIEIEPGIDGLLHVSDMSWTRKISHPSEMLKKSDELKAVVLTVDQEKMRIALGLKQMTEDPWYRAIPERYIPGQIVKGHVTKLTNFGVFVELEEELEGLLHVSELADHKVETPEEIVKIGDEIEVKILRVDQDERKIGLSLKRAQWAAEGDASTDSGSGPGPGRSRRRGGLHGATGDLGNESVIEDVLFHAQSPGAPAETAEHKAETETKLEAEAPGEGGAESLAMEILSSAGAVDAEKPEAEKAAEPEAEKAAEPEAEKAAEPKAEKAAEPEAEKAAEPEAEKVAEKPAQQEPETPDDAS